MNHLDPTALQAWLVDPVRPKPVLLDVREGWEFDKCRIEGARLIPMREIQARWDELDADSEVVVICHHGVRSYHVARFLEQQGFGKVYNLSGGVDGWAKQVDRTMATY